MKTHWNAALARDPGDFTGIPFNDAGRAKALTYVQSEISMPERGCALLFRNGT